MNLNNIAPPRRPQARRSWQTSDAHPVEIEHNRRAIEARRIATALQGQPARVLSEMLLQLDGRSPGTLAIAARYAALDPNILRATGGDKFVPGPALVAEKK